MGEEAAGRRRKGCLLQKTTGTCSAPTCMLSGTNASRVRHMKRYGREFIYRVLVYRKLHATESEGEGGVGFIYFISSADITCSCDQQVGNMVGQ
jgi:hypothetical protein